MDKKGTIEFSIGTIVVIVLSITMLILGMVLVKNFFNFEKFNITKEECVNEKIYLPSNVDLRFEFEEFNSFDDKGFSFNLSSIDLGNLNVIYFYYNEICKDVEVMR